MGSSGTATVGIEETQITDTYLQFRDLAAHFLESRSQMERTACSLTRCSALNDAPINTVIDPVVQIAL